MGPVIRLVHSVIRFGVLLGVMGGLAETTVEIINRAGGATQAGMVSLGKLNALLK